MQKNHHPSEAISIKIVSARYGPCEGIRLPTGELTNDASASIPLSRDVAPFLRALLSAARTEEKAPWNEEQNINYEYIGDREEDDNEPFPQIVNVQPTVGSMTKSFIFLLGGGKSMNAVFGDPCPGISKRLIVHYIVTEALVTEVHHVSFAEHERVILRRRLTFFQDDSDLKKAVAEATSARGEVGTSTDNHHRTLLLARKMGRSQSIAEFASALNQSHASARTSSSVPTSLQARSIWRLRSSVSEMIVPLALPFLEVQERVMCRLVCRCWKHIVRDWGVATTIDSNDSNISNFSRPFLRGILSHSHSSLHSLLLSGFESLQKEDLHTAIPHLRKLRSLDISRCLNLDDSTLILLSENVHKTLEVLYIKGLERVSDRGVKAICRSCSKLEVLEVSFVSITDEAGVAIQQLKRLRALFMRDNYQLTNKSIDVITAKCRRLTQLTLWGCIKMRQFTLPFSDSRLVILNLWGCYNLNDECAETLTDMSNLSSLIVSECHRLTDRFVEILARKASQLNHLYMRYCKRLTDNAVNIITNSMCNLYSLDLSFCTRVTVSSIFKLLDIRFDSLSELRLKNCSQLDIATQSNLSARQRVPVSVGGTDGRIITNAIRSHADHCLSILDMRECVGVIQTSGTSVVGYSDKDPFVMRLRALGFEQRVSGFFYRPARWSSVQRHLVEEMQSI